MTDPDALIQQIHHNREILEHATMVYAGIEYLEAHEDDRVLRDELSADGLTELRSALAFVIARKAADVHRLGNGLPMPKDERN